MSLEDDEISTLMVVPFFISTYDDTLSVEQGSDPDGQDPVTRSDLNEMNSLFAVKEVELLELRAALQDTIGKRDAELAKARKDWELEIDHRVAEAVEQDRVYHRQEYEAKEEAIRKSRTAREELTVEKAAAERKQAKAESERRLQAERRQWESESAARLGEALQKWESEVGSRLKAAHQAWQVESEKRNEVERQKWQAQAEGDAAKDRNRRQSDAAQRLDVARQVWKAEADELRSIELQSWEAEANRRVEAECTRLEAEVEQRIAAERQRLLSENEASAKRESLREGANYSAPAPGQVDHETIKKLAEERDKNRQLDAGLQAADGKNRELKAALAALTLRCENAERAPAAAQSSPPMPDLEDRYIKRLHSEIGTLHRSLADQAASFGRARAKMEQARPLHILPAPQNRRIGAVREFKNEEEQTLEPEKSKGLIRDCILVVAIIIPLVLLYPWIAVYLPQVVREGIATVTGGLLSVEIVQPATPKKPLSPPMPVRPTAVTSRVLNVRASPALKGAVMLSLLKNASVVVLEKQGNWSKIECPADGAGKPQQGWVWSAYLRSKDR